MRMRNAWIVFGITLLIALPARLYQNYYLMDRKTGFYTGGGTATAIVSICLAVGIVLMIILAALASRTPKAYRPIHSSPAAVVGALTGLGVVVESVISLTTGSGVQNYFMYMILSIVGILAGGVFILTAYDFATGDNHFTKLPLLALIPSIWGCLCLVTLFITYVAVVNVSENIFDTFTVIFLLLFLFAQAKLLAGVGDHKSGRMIFIFGIPAMLLSLVTGISGVASVLLKEIQTSYFPTGLYFANILLSLYIAVFLVQAAHFPDLERENPDLAEQTDVQESVLKQEADPAAPHTELCQSKNCAEFLADAYRSEEMFVERVSSPFYQCENENC